MTTRKSFTMRRLLALALLLPLLLTKAFGEGPKCKGNRRVVSACYVVRGRMTFGAGTPALRIWPIGTRRMLGVTAGPHADDASDPVLPDELKRLITGHEAIFGNFEVCPFTPERKGRCRWCA